MTALFAMRPLVLGIHITAGVVALLTGYLALFATKGAPLHRRGGMAFVYAMIVMGLGASVLYMSKGQSGLGGVLVLYFVVTGVTTLRPHTPRVRLLDATLMLVALGIGLAMIASGMQTVAAGKSARDGVPVGMSFFMGAITLAAAASDARVLRAGGLVGPRRLARHLLRMCYALWIAAGSFFIGQSDELPEALRAPVLLAIPIVAVWGSMAYWYWRVRMRRVVRGLVQVAQPARGRA
jgi:hypothetical protein